MSNQGDRVSTPVLIAVRKRGTPPAQAKRDRVCACLAHYAPTFAADGWREPSVDPIIPVDMQSDIASFRVQLRVIGALMMRELHTRYGRENIGFAWFIGEPIVFTFGVVLLWSQTRGESEHGISLVAFVLTGYTPLVMWRHCFAQSISALRANGSLLYHRQVTFLDILIARSAIEIAGSILAFIIGIIVFAVLLGVAELPHGQYGLMIAGWLIYAWFSFGTMLLVAVVTELSHIAEKLSQVVGYIMIPLCGAFWMVDWLPEWLRSYILYMPSVSAFEMIRASYFGDAVKTYYAPLTACFVCAGMMFAGLFGLKRARNHLAVE